MNPKYKRIYTCTPYAFHANDGFFIRDSGLICKTLLSMGIESKSVMPLPYYEDDQKEDLIRTSMSNLKSAQWWKEQNIDGVVLYSWGAPRYTGVAKAIKKAGIRLVIHMDTSGSFDKLLPEEYTWWKAIIHFAKTAINNIPRSRHLGYADIITVSSSAAESMAKMMYMNDSIIHKHYPMPCPVSPECKYDNTHKEDIILCIGRWHDERQKRTRLLMHTLECYYEKGGTADTLIYGALTKELSDWYTQLPNFHKEHIHLKGYLNNHQLHQEYNRAKVVLCTSSFESSHIVSAEGLCCGCSVVTPNRPEHLRCLLWYTTKESGTVSQEDTPESLAEALLQELQQWEKGNRNPEKIAQSWQPHFHADKVMHELFS